MINNYHHWPALLESLPAQLDSFLALTPSFCRTIQVSTIALLQRSIIYFSRAVCTDYHYSTKLSCSVYSFASDTRLQFPYWQGPSGICLCISRALHNNWNCEYILKSGNGTKNSVWGGGGWEKTEKMSDLLK